MDNNTETLKIMKKILRKNKEDIGSFCNYLKDILCFVSDQSCPDIHLLS